MREVVKKFIDRHQLIHKGDKIIVGVSGGPDSMALLHFLWRMSETWALDLIAVHIDHMFRGNQSYDDYQYVERVCESLCIPFEGVQINVSAYQKQHQLSPQVAARHCRYQFFEQMMEKHQANALALAHHGDDQIETMLMRLTRGTTLKGLGGIEVKRPFKSGFLIRPLLLVAKEDVVTYCEHHKITPRLDPSNEKESYTRNRFRKHILPFLKKENPNVHERFQRTSEILIEEDQFLDELTKNKLNAIIKNWDRKEIVIPLNEFKELPMPLQRRGIHLILNYLYHPDPLLIYSIHIDDILALIYNSHPSGTLDLPKGIKTIRSYNEFVLTTKAEVNPTYEQIIPIPGDVKLPNGFQLTVRFGTIENEVHKDIFSCNREDVQLPLIVRTRKPGDRMTLKGISGSKKVKDIFIDQKIPLRERDQWPIVTDSNGQIIWIPGLKKSGINNTRMAEGTYLVMEYTICQSSQEAF